MRTEPCAICGRRHAPLEPTVGYVKPAAFFVVPAAERAARVKINTDLCSIDDRFFLIRGVARVPYTDVADDHFEWGLWAQVSESAFRRALELWEVDGSGEPPFDGLVSAEPPGYDGLMDHPCKVQLIDATQRPLITLEPSDHLMCREQRDGITRRRMHEIQHVAFPHLFT